mgnify:CR=1 FL=1
MAASNVIERLPEDIRDKFFILTGIDRSGVFRAVDIRHWLSKKSYGELGVKTDGSGFNLGLGSRIGLVDAHVGITNSWNLKNLSPYVGATWRVKIGEGA